MNENENTTPATEPASRADMHCHSDASERSRLGVQRAVGLPECATPPEEVYDLAKRRGMDFVTITDHDTIDGVLQIAERPDVFVSEELTAGFRGEPQAVHVLCFGISPEDHEWLQAHRTDVELCAAYMYEREIACALAHPYYTVAAPLTARHRRRLAELFGVWEVRNGARAPELNRPAEMYVATRESVGIAGSDDHAGVDIGRTWTETPAAADPEEFLAHVRSGRATARGAQGSAAKWAHAAIALAIRALEPGGAGPTESPQARPAPDPLRVLSMASRLLREGDRREGSAAGEVSSEDARALLGAWLRALDVGEGGGAELIARMQAEDFSHSDLFRRACRAHERKLAGAVEMAVAAAHGELDAASAARGLFDACIAAVPYAPAAAFLANEQAKLRRISPPGPGGGRRDDAARVAILADGIGSTHGVSRTIQEIRQRGVPGFEIEIVGTDAQVDRRLAAVAEVDVPFYPGLRIGVPSLPGVVQALADGCYDAVHVCSPGPAGIAGALVARALGLPLLGSYHTELAAYADLRSGQARLVEAMQSAVSLFYSSCEVVLSPSPASDEALAEVGISSERVLRWDRGVDTGRFDPALRRRRDGEETLRVLYSGRITREKGVELLAETFLAARAREPRLHLMVAGGGPEQERLASLLGSSVSFLGWLDGTDLAQAYADADVFLFPSATDTFGQVILEAQASGLPVLAVAEGGPRSLIEDGVTGLLRPADSEALAAALLELAGAPLRRRALAAAALNTCGPGPGSVRSSCWPAATRGRSTARAPAPPRRGQHELARAHDRGRAPRHRAGDLRALRGDPRLARRPRRRPRDPARDPGPRPAPCRRALARDGELARRAPGGRRLDRPARVPARVPAPRRDARPPAGRVQRPGRGRDAPCRARGLARAEARRDRAGRLRRARVRVHGGAAPRDAAAVPLVGRPAARAPHRGRWGLRAGDRLARAGVQPGRRRAARPHPLPLARPGGCDAADAHAADRPAPGRPASSAPHVGARVGAAALALARCRHLRRAGRGLTRARGAWGPPGATVPPPQPPLAAGAFRSEGLNDLIAGRAA